MSVAITNQISSEVTYFGHFGIELIEIDVKVDGPLKTVSKVL
jgi:hypothetical protein